MMDPLLPMLATSASPFDSCDYVYEPVAGSRVKSTPVPESSPMLSKTIEQMLAAVPQSCRYPFLSAIDDVAVIVPGGEDGGAVHLLYRIVRELGKPMA